MKTPNQAELDLINEHLSYQEDTGDVVWLKTYNRYSRAKPGDVAGSLNHGYLRVKLLGKYYSNHHLAWYLAHGGWPQKHIDHINGIPSDNRLTNLRLCTHQENHANRKTQESVSGYKGVSPKDNKWQARVCHNNIRYYLGLHSTKEEAALAYNAKAKVLFGDFARLNTV